MKALLLLALSSCTGLAATVRLTMDEVPSQLINGLSVVKGGVTFTFANPEGFVYYGALFADLPLTYIEGRVLESPLGRTFSVDFSESVFSVQFGMAYPFPASIGDSLAAVSVYSDTNVLFTGVSKCTVLFGITFAQGQFSYTSDVPITRIVIAPMIHPYAIDNLTVNTAPETPTIPVVSPPVLVGLALAVSLCGYLVSKKARPRLSPPS